MALFKISENFGKIDFNGYIGRLGDGVRSDYGHPGRMELVVDGTDVVFHDVYGEVDVSVDGGPDVTYGGANYANVAAMTGAAPGKHLLRVALRCYFQGEIEVTGGAAQIVSVAKKYAFLQSNIAGYPVEFSMPTEPSIVAIQGAYKSDGQGYCETRNYGSFIQQVGFNGTALESFCLCESRPNALSLDGGAETIVPLAGAVNNFGLARVTEGVAKGAHTARLIDLSGGNTGYYALRVLNGTRVMAAISTGATSATVESAAGLNVGDWVRLGYINASDFVQVSSIASNVISFVSTPAKIAHETHSPFESYHVPQGSFAAWRSAEYPAPDRSIALIGDSNIHAWNEFGQNNVPDQSGLSYGLYDHRASYGGKFGKKYGWESINLGIQGNSTTDMFNRRQDIVDCSRGPLDVIIIGGLTNDANNGGAVSPATAKTNLQAIIDVAKTRLKVGGRIILDPVKTPIGAVAAYQQVQAELVTANPGVELGSTLYDGINLSTETNALHFLDSAHEKKAENLAILLGLATISPPTETGLTPEQAEAIAMIPGLDAKLNSLMAALTALPLPPTAAQNAAAVVAKSQFQALPAATAQAVKQLPEMRRAGAIDTRYNDDWQVERLGADGQVVATQNVTVVNGIVMAVISE